MIGAKKQAAAKRVLRYLEVRATRGKGDVIHWHGLENETFELLVEDVALLASLVVEALPASGDLDEESPITMSLYGTKAECDKERARRQDAARLDFIEANPDKPLRKHKKRWAMVGFTNYEYENHATVRAAIDAAILANQSDRQEGISHAQM